MFLDLDPAGSCSGVTTTFFLPTIFADVLTTSNSLSYAEFVILVNRELAPTHNQYVVGITTLCWFSATICTSFPVHSENWDEMKTLLRDWLMTGKRVEWKAKCAFDDSQVNPSLSEAIDDLSLDGGDTSTEDDGDNASMTPTQSTFCSGNPHDHMSRPGSHHELDPEDVTAQVPTNIEINHNFTPRREFPVHDEDGYEYQWLSAITVGNERRDLFLSRVVSTSAAGASHQDIHYGEITPTLNMHMALNNMEVPLYVMGTSFYSNNKVSLVFSYRGKPLGYDAKERVVVNALVDRMKEELQKNGCYQRWEAGDLSNIYEASSSNPIDHDQTTPNILPPDTVFGNDSMTGSEYFNEIPSGCTNTIRDEPVDDQGPAEVEHIGKFISRRKFPACDPKGYEYQYIRTIELKGRQYKLYCSHIELVDDWSYENVELFLVLDNFEVPLQIRAKSLHALSAADSKHGRFFFEHGSLPEEKWSTYTSEEQGAFDGLYLRVNEVLKNDPDSYERLRSGDISDIK